MPLQIYTARYSATDPDRLDITRSGANRYEKEHGKGSRAPGEFLAPSNRLLWPHRRAMRAARGLATLVAAAASYRQGYFAEMRLSYRERRAEWDALLGRPRVVLVCFCAHRDDCHRGLAAEILGKLGAEDRGELT